MADGAFSELSSAVPPWPYSLPRWCRPAAEPRHRPSRRPSHRAQPARQHRRPRPAAPLVALPLAARRAQLRPVGLRRARLRPTPRRPVLARRRRRARRLTPSPPRPRAPAEVGRPGSSTSCCSTSAYWRSWPVPGALPIGERSCATADTLATAGVEHVLQMSSRPCARSRRRRSIRHPPNDRAGRTCRQPPPPASSSRTRPCRGRQWRWRARRGLILDRSP